LWYKYIMKLRLTYIHIFILLILALALCPLLGGNCGILEGMENNGESRSPYTQSKSKGGESRSPYTNASYNTAQKVEELEPISKTKIPEGTEDMYVLRSEVANLLKKNSCPPCQPCARCPEPSFECKKVPTYSKLNNGYLPKPVLNDFSTFAS